MAKIETDKVKATKLYEISEKEQDGMLFVSEYYLEGGDLNYNEHKINKYRITISPDIIIYHTIVKDGHILKNMIRFVNEHGNVHDKAEEES